MDPWRCPRPTLSCLPPAAGTFGAAYLSLLQGPSITALAEDITVAGQQVSDLGLWTGMKKVHKVAAEESGIGRSLYVLTLPPYSAGLLTIPISNSSALEIFAC